MASSGPVASFDVEVGIEDALAFAKLSGDWNPLHTDRNYAAGTSFGRQVLHGAFSAGLVSRMAGMFLPGQACLLHGMKLRFLAPILPPVTLSIQGRQMRGGSETGSVEVSVTDKQSGRHYVSASYDFGRHELAEEARPSPSCVVDGDAAAVLVTGASGSLASAVLRQLGNRGVAMSRSGSGSLATGDRDGLAATLSGRRLAGIVHAGWPQPDNLRLLKLTSTEEAIDHQIAAPLQEIVQLARLLVDFGAPGASLILIGSTAADPGRHAYRAPLYCIAKATIPTLCRALALELAAFDRRCAAVVFDVVNAGMNQGMSEAQRQMHADRVPAGRLATADDAAQQLLWMLDNRSFLLSGATVSLSGGALP